MKKMGDADGSRPLYVMDDDYIEQKYVKAEEERQRQAELDRARREREEAEAFAEAERQRKAAEAERRRKKEESERQEQLEAARMHRETVELERKKQQKDFENNLKDIEEELNALELSRSNFLSEKLGLAKDHKREEESLREPLDEIQKQKEELLLREQDLKIKMREFERRAEQERMQLEQKEGARDARIRELTQKRRQVQTDMLHFLQQPTTVAPVSAPNPKPLYSIQPTSAPSHMSQPNAAKMGAPKKAGYPTFQNEAPNPVHQSFSPQPMSSFSPIPGGYPTFAPSAPSQTALPSVEIVGNDRNGTVNDINEQIALLDEFFGSGVLSKAEYEDAKRQVYEAGKAKGAGVTGGIDMKNLPTATAVTQGPPPDSVDAQILQLDDFLRGGVLTQGEYNDAKEKVLADAKAKSGGNAAAPKLVAPSTEEVFVTVPAGAKPGTAVRIRHNGMQYDVVVPPGMTVGSRFKAVIPK